MKLAAFEELVLLVVGTLGNEAYGVNIKETLTIGSAKIPALAPFIPPCTASKTKDM